MSVLEWISIVFVAGGLATFAVIALDLLGHPQRIAIMDAVWPLTGLYLGPLAFVLYRALGRPHAKDTRPPGPHEKEGAAPIVLSTSHCAAGCVLGDIAGTWIVQAFGVRIAGERLFAEYAMMLALAWLFGIAFQYFVIRPTTDETPGEAVVDAIKADTLSILAFQAGTFAWLALVGKVFFAELPPVGSATYWFMLQIGLVLGFLAAMPANVWLLQRGVKHEM